MPRKLCIPNLVAPASEVAWTIDLDQKVRVASTFSIEESRLVDKVIAATHRDECGLSRLAQAVARVRNRGVRLDSRDAGPRILELREEARLMLETALSNSIKFGVDPHRPLDEPVGCGAVKVRQVLAGQEANEISSRVD